MKEKTIQSKKINTNVPMIYKYKGMQYYHKSKNTLLTQYLPNKIIIENNKLKINGHNIKQHLVRPNVPFVYKIKNYRLLNPFNISNIEKYNITGEKINITQKEINIIINNTLTWFFVSDNNIDNYFFKNNKNVSNNNVYIIPVLLIGLFLILILMKFNRRMMLPQFMRPSYMIPPYRMPYS